MAEGLLVLILNIMHRSTYKGPSAIVRSYRQLTLSSPSQLHSAQLPFSPIILRRRLTVASRSSFSSSHSSHATLPPSLPSSLRLTVGRFRSLAYVQQSMLLWSLDTRTRHELILCPLIRILARCPTKLSCASHPNSGMTFHI